MTTSQTKVHPTQQKPETSPKPVDPVTRQLIRGSLRAARLECELIIERTAMSAFIREKKDYTVSFLDAAGQEVYGETMGSDIMGCVWDYYPAESMRTGDLYWYNDPYISQGSITHTPDMVFIARCSMKEMLSPTVTRSPTSGTWAARGRAASARPTPRYSTTGPWCRPSR